MYYSHVYCCNICQSGYCLYSIILNTKTKREKRKAQHVEYKILYYILVCILSRLHIIISIHLKVLIVFMK